MKCYYEVLEVPRDAEDSEIKTSYRKLALKYHPDKNIDNPEEARVQFQVVQQAYEVLSDRHERAWYDNHREQILLGSNKDYQDDSLDVYQYFTTQCFKGYGDDENGFYTVYCQVFEKLTKEDIQHMDSKSDYDEIPQFGNSSSDYNDVVGPFYAYWLSYTTKKSYVWLDTININEARNNRELKFIEKENKKVRLKAKKERNEEIRNLVAFVRKRDKRVQANAKKLEAKIKENRTKQEQLRKQKILENKKALEGTSEAQWSKFDNVQHELEQIEKHLAVEFGENLSETGSDESETENDLYCVVCNKVFKTVKAFEKHESSKKHKENVELLKQTMLEEEDEILSCFPESDLDSDVNELFCKVCNKEYKTIKAYRDHESGQKHLQNLEKQNGDQDDTDLQDQDDVEIPEEQDDEPIEINSSTKKKNKKSKKVIRTQILSTTCDEHVEKPLLEISDVYFDFGSSKKRSKKKNKTKPESKKVETEGQTPDNCEDSNETKNESPEISKKESSEVSKKMKKAQRKNVVQIVNSVNSDEIDLSHCCAVCKTNFNSKNKLFDHLKKTGHSTYLPEKVTKSSKKRQK